MHTLTLLRQERAPPGRRISRHMTGPPTVDRFHHVQQRHLRSLTGQLESAAWASGAGKDMGPDEQGGCFER